MPMHVTSWPGRELSFPKVSDVNSQCGQGETASPAASDDALQNEITRSSRRSSDNFKPPELAATLDSEIDPLLTKEQ